MVFCENATILLLFPYKLCIKSPFRVCVEVYINLLRINSDYLNKENVSEGIYDAVLNLKTAEAFAAFLGNLPSYVGASGTADSVMLLRLLGNSCMWLGTMQNLRGKKIGTDGPIVD